MQEQPDEQDEYSHSSAPHRVTQEPDLEIVSDPRMSPPQVTLFDATDFDRWIQTDEDLLIDLTAIR